MTELKEKNKISLKGWFSFCPARHILTILGLCIIGLYFLIRQNETLITALCENVTRPWHRFFSRITAPLPFSFGEAIIVVGVLAALVYIIITIVQLIRKDSRLKRLYRFLLTVLTAVSLIYAGFCLFWGAYYYTSDFEEQSGVYGAPLSTEQLETVTRYFTAILNEYADDVQRNEYGFMVEPLAPMFEKSNSLYHEAERIFPCLSGNDVPAKPFFFSRAMSYIQFTGFFFPFTAEANINIDSPPCLIPSTIAHELAHQRGVAQEDEANFVGIMASLENGDPVYCYSAALLAYIHLGNALYSADYDAWADNIATLHPGANADIILNNYYWAQFKTPVSTVSDYVYTGFLQSYGQTLGLKTYGKCIDLLVAYYYDDALSYLNAKNADS